MRIQSQRETYGFWALAAPLDLQEYRNERGRQERALEETTGAYPAEIADYHDRGGKPLITYKDWLKSRKTSDGEWNDRLAPRSNEVHVPDASAWGGEAPPW